MKRSDLYLNYLVFYLISQLGLLPIRMTIRRRVQKSKVETITESKSELTVGQIKILRKGTRHLIWRIWFYLGVFHGFFMSGRLVQCLVRSDYVEMGHLSLHVVVACFSMTMMWVMYNFEYNFKIFPSLFYLFWTSICHSMTMIYLLHKNAPF